MLGRWGECSGRIRLRVYVRGNACRHPKRLGHRPVSLPKLPLVLNFCELHKHMHAHTHFSPRNFATTRRFRGLLNVQSGPSNFAQHRERAWPWSKDIVTKRQTLTKRDWLVMSRTPWVSKSCIYTDQSQFLNNTIKLAQTNHK